MNKPLVRLTAVAAAATLALTACATGTSTSQSTSTFDPDAAVSGDLSISGFNSETDEVATTRFDLAVQAVDGVNVESDQTGFDTQAFLAAVAGGSAPDLIYVSRDTVGTLAARGAIDPLESCTQGEGIDTEKFIPTAMSQVTLNDQFYGIPEFSVADVLIANTNLLDEAGLTLDDVDGSDWEALSAASEAMARLDGKNVEVLGFDSKMPEFFPLWAKANGVDILSEDGQTANLNDPAVVEAVEFATGIYEDEGGFAAVKAAKDASDFFGEGNQYATDTLGAMPIEQWYVNVLNDVSPDAPLDFTTFKTQSGEPISYATGQAWAIPTGSGNKAAACRFANAMTTTDTWVAAAQARIDGYAGSDSLFTGLLTANTEADAAVKAMIEPTDGTFQNAIDAAYEASDASFTLAGNPADAQFKAAWTDAINRVLTGEAEAQESLDQAQVEAQEALDSAWSSFGN